MNNEATLTVVLAAAVYSISLNAEPPNAEIAFVSTFGERGNQGPAGTFFHPIGTGLDSNGNLIVSEWGNARIQRCSFNGECEIIVENMEFQPLRLAITGDDTMLLTGWPEHHEITACTASGQCSTAFGSFGDGPGQFNDPVGLQFDSKNRIVVADKENNRVQFCNLDGECTAFGSFNSGPDAMPGEFWRPSSVLADGTGRLFVGENGDEVVTVCDESGQCVARMGIEGIGNGQFKTPSSLGITSRGDLVVFESGNHRLQVCDISDFDIAGDCVIFGEFGEGEGQFAFPKGFVDDQDRIVIADEDNHRIQVLQITYNEGSTDFEINPGLNDAWFNSATSGQGFFITVFGDIQMMFLAWFTFDTERPDESVQAMLGEPGHRWLTAFGPYSGNVAELDLELTSGGIFDSSDPAPSQVLDGTISIEFTGCNEAMVTYDIFSAGVSGMIPIERIALDNVAGCETFAQ